MEESTVSCVQDPSRDAARGFRGGLAVKLRILFATLLTVFAAGWLAAAPGARTDMVVHEWGTFLAMNGSDGVSLDGMYHEEHALPGFVHARSKDQLKMRSALV